MPALKIIRGINFTTRPFAGDDLHIICIVLATYRVLQTLCLLPLIIDGLIKRIRGSDIIINGYYDWCPQHSVGKSAAFIVGTRDEQQLKNLEITEDRFGMVFTIMTTIFVFIDFTWILCVWSAASIGTPTQPMGRDEYLRPLIVFKMFAVNIFPILLLALGITKIAHLRKDNYGCGDEEPLFYPDEGPLYGLFCVLMVTFALELLVFPAIVTNKIVHLIRSKTLVRKRYATHAKGERLEQCLGCIFKCISLCSKDQGGKDLKNKGEMKDFASNLMEFANNDAKVDVVLSDMYVGGKLLARVQAERRFLAIQKLKTTSKKIHNEEPEENVDVENIMKSSDRRQVLQSRTLSRYKEVILTVQQKPDSHDYVVSEKNVLSSTKKEDVEILHTAGHYSNYALFIYMDILDAAMNDFGLDEDCQTFIRDVNNLLNQPSTDSYRLTRMGCEHAHLCYANFINGLAITPYAIIVDEMKETVVITIRGTFSLEDWVADLQYVPLPLDDVGSMCGFNGEGHHCHKGVLTRAKWLYNDIKTNKVLKLLYSSGSQYKNYNLVVVGHSLGGGCACVLSMMLRPTFPSLKCFAFEPPGCIFDENLAGQCDEFIVSFVRHDDLVPRITQPNLETLRDEFFDVLARIKVPKIQAFRDCRSPILNDAHLAKRNSKILCPRHQIERDTPFYEQVRKFRTERAAKNQTGEVSVKLYIPGKIIHLVNTTGNESSYIPYWASRYEFNQVILSRTMLSDHSMLCLPDILRAIDLEHLPNDDALHIRENNDKDEEDPTFLKFMLCSSPNGRFPSLLAFCSLAGCILSLVSNTICKFVARETTIIYQNATSVSGIDLSAGLFSYTLKQCKHESTDCETNSAEDLEDTKYCQPYPLVVKPDSYWGAARIFAVISLILGLCGLAFISLATCTKMKSRRWKAPCAIFLLASLCQGLQFLLLESNLCHNMSFAGVDYVAEAECSLAKGAYFSIAALIFYFITAVGCARMIRRK